ncbi:MAG: hypothetical protein D6736_20060 [Nitrospinota bacterium]|nr:MAG: hypothetical protein D6736_20060 [Nitrospinota bacterium]
MIPFLPPCSIKLQRFTYHILEDFSCSGKGNLTFSLTRAEGKATMRPRDTGMVLLETGEG